MVESENRFEVAACLRQLALFLQVFLGTFALFALAVLGGWSRHGCVAERWRSRGEQSCASSELPGLGGRDMVCVGSF